MGHDSDNNDDDNDADKASRRQSSTKPPACQRPLRTLGYARSCSGSGKHTCKGGDGDGHGHGHGRGRGDCLERDQLSRVLRGGAQEPA